MRFLFQKHAIGSQKHKLRDAKPLTTTEECYPRQLAHIKPYLCNALALLYDYYSCMHYVRLRRDIALLSDFQSEVSMTTAHKGMNPVRSHSDRRAIKY